VSGLNNKQYKVIVSNNCGYVYACATLTVKAGCKAPTNPRVCEVTGYSAKLVWDFVYGAKKYEVQFRKLSSTNWTTFYTYCPKLILTKLCENTEYCFRVRTICSNCGCSCYKQECVSAWTNEVCFKTGKCQCKGFDLSYLNSDENFNMNVYPNPSTGIVNVTLPYTDSASELTIYDMSGQKVFSTTVNIPEKDNIKHIDMSGYQRGVYFIRLNNNNIVKTVKLILQ
jgi:hypothetical protein